MEKWKKVILAIVTGIIILRIGYIGLWGETDREYCSSASYDLMGAESVPFVEAEQYFSGVQGRLSSVEFVFNNIAADKAGRIMLALYADDELIYQTNISLSGINNGEWKNVYINAEIEEEKEYRMALVADKACTQIPELFVAKNGWAPEITASYSDGERIGGQIAVNYVYLGSPGAADRVVMISLWMLLWAAVFACLYYFDSIMKMLKTGKDYLLSQVKPQILLPVLEVIGCMIIIGSSGIEFQAPTKVILYVISLIAAVNYEKKSWYVKSLADCTWKRILLLFLYVYAAFALVGQRIWIYPLTLKLTMGGLFVFLCTVAWFIPVTQSLLYYMEKACTYAFSAERKMKTWQFIVAIAVLLLVPAAYNLYAYNPGISSSDTLVSMVTNAQNLRGMYDWHPVFYCMVLRAIEEVWNSPYAVILVQYFFWAYVVTELMLYLRKKGIKESVLIAVALFTGLNAGNYIHINTIWKDIPYTLSLFWSLIIVAKLCMDSEEYKQKWFVYLELVVALVGMYLYRKNGMVSFIVVVVPLVLVLLKNIRLLVSIAVSVALIFAIKGPVYDYLEVEDPGRYGMYIGLGQDILGVYYAEGEVSESTLQMITVMTNYNNAEYSYDPMWSNQNYDLNVKAGDFICNYMDTFIRNPVIMTRAVMAREDALWDIYAGKDSTLGCVNYTGTVDGDPEWNEQYAARKFVSLYPVASAASSYTASSQWISAIEWRGGLFTLLGMIAVCFLIIKKGRGKYLLITTPAIGHIMGLLLSTGWADFRYFWPVNLLSMAMILLSIVIAKETDTEGIGEKDV